MICKTCGSEIDNSITVCPVCGSSVNEPVGAAPQQPAYQPPQQPDFQAQQPPQQPNYQQPAYQQPNYQAQQQYVPQMGYQMNSGYVLDQYVQCASSINTMSVCAVIFSLLCGWIGLVLAIVSNSKIKSLPLITPETLDPSQVYIYQDAQKKVNTSKTLNTVAIVLFVINIIVGFISGFASGLASVL